MNTKNSVQPIPRRKIPLSRNFYSHRGRRDAPTPDSGDTVYIDVALKFQENTGIKLKTDRITTGFSSVLDDKIKNNLPTIARVKYGSSKNASGDHFVVIVGKTSDGKKTRGFRLSGMNNAMIHSSGR